MQFCWAKYCSIWKFLLKVGFSLNVSTLQHWTLAVCHLLALGITGQGITPLQTSHCATVPTQDLPFALPPKSTPFYFSKSSIFHLARFSIFFFHFKYSHLPPRAALSGRITNWTQTLIALIVVQVPAAIST